MGVAAQATAIVAPGIVQPWRVRSVGIGRALIGKPEGDVIEVSTPGGVKSYEILKVIF